MPPASRYVIGLRQRQREKNAGLRWNLIAEGEPSVCIVGLRAATQHDAAAGVRENQLLPASTDCFHCVSVQTAVCMDDIDARQ